MPNSKYNFWLGILIIWLSHLMMDFMLGVWPVYKTFITLDLVIAGLIASLSIFIGEGLQLYFGVLSDRGFHQRLIALGVGLTVTIPFLAYSSNEWILFLFVLCAFIGSGAFHPAASSLLAASSTSYKSSLIALFACGGMVGAASSQYVFINIYSAFNGQTWVLAVPILILALCCALFKFPKMASPPKKIKMNQLWEMVKPRRFELSLLYIIEVCLQVVLMSFAFLLPDILKVKGYDDWFCLGGGYFYFVIGSALTSMPIGYCVDKFGYKPILTLITLGSIGFLYLFLIAESLALFPIIVLLMLLGGTMGVVVPVVVAGGNSLVPSQASGFISALYMGGVSGLAGFGPMVSSMIASYFTENAPVIALQVLSILLIIALSLIYFLPQSSSTTSDFELYPVKVAAD